MAESLLQRLRQTGLPGIQLSFVKGLALLLVECNVHESQLHHIHVHEYKRSQYVYDAAPEADVPEFYVLMQLLLTDQPILPYPSATKSEICFLHVTTPSGLRGILQQRKIMPIYSREECGGPGFVTFGFRNPTTDSMSWDFPRVAHRAHLDPKNRCNVFVTGRAIGTCKTITQGGVVAACSSIAEELVVHENRTKRWCVHTDYHNITGLAFKSDAEWYI